MNYAVTVSIRDTHRWLIDKRTVAIEASSVPLAAKKALQSFKESLKGRTQIKEAVIRVLWVKPVAKEEDGE